MQRITFAVMGMGNRGTAYAAKALKYPQEMEITAMADTRRIRLDAANKYLHLPEERLFDSAEALLRQPKLADIMVVATQDAQHRDHAIKAMELGYDLLLEKPISNKLYVQRYCDEVEKIDLESLCDDFTGHGGGDARIVYDVIRYMRGDDFDTSSMTTIDRSVESHILAFAAEHSRILGSELVKLEEFEKSIGLRR